MKTEIRGRTYSVRYFHVDPQTAKNENIDAGTGCVIDVKNGSAWENVVTCFVKLYYRDEFSKKDGRKFAFAKAVKRMTDDTLLRRLFWKAWHEHHGTKNVAE